MSINQDIIEFIKQYDGVSDDEIVKRVRDYINNTDDSWKDMKKQVNKLLDRYDYDQMATDILTRFGILLTPATCKKIKTLFKN